jgi:hypothetical protein
LVELTLTLTNLGHPQQSPPLIFVDNECAIGLATSSVRPKKSKSKLIDMRLDWIKERAGQNFFRLVFLPGLINPADFFTKILPVYRHIAALTFLHGTPYYHPQPPHPFPLPITQLHHHSSRRDAVRDRDPPTLAFPSLQHILFYLSPSPCQHVTLLTSLRCTPVLLPHRYAGTPTHLTTPAPPPDVGFKPFRVLHYS